jgi:hypothetical protein
MLLEGAHDSRAGPPAGARRRDGPSGAVVRCAARGAAFAKACLQLAKTIARARAVARSVQIRVDAHGLVGLWIQSLC